MKPQLFRFLEMLALNESSELEPDLARCISYIYCCHCVPCLTFSPRDCNIALACLASHMVPLAVLPTTVDTIESISASPSWKARNAILEFLQVDLEHLIEATVFLPPPQRCVCSTTWLPFIPNQNRLLECVLLLPGDQRLGLKTQSDIKHHNFQVAQR